jgi:hypothetical protein
LRRRPILAKLEHLALLATVLITCGAAGSHSAPDRRCGSATLLHRRRTLQHRPPAANGRTEDRHDRGAAQPMKVVFDCKVASPAIDGFQENPLSRAGKPTARKSAITTSVSLHRRWIAVPTFASTGLPQLSSVFAAGTL